MDSWKIGFPSGEVDISILSHTTVNNEQILWYHGESGIKWTVLGGSGHPFKVNKYIQGKLNAQTIFMEFFMILYICHMLVYYIVLAQPGQVTPDSQYVTARSLDKLL